MDCMFFISSLYCRDKSYEEIRGHILKCTECVMEFEDAFESYLNGQREFTIMDELEMPEGISSREDFLKQLVISFAARHEEVEFSIESMCEKLDTDEVQFQVFKLIRSQNRLMAFRMRKAPAILVDREINTLEKIYLNLHELMGHRAFWCLMGQEIPSHGDDRSIAPIIKWWRRSSLSAQ